MKRFFTIYEGCVENRVEALSFESLFCTNGYQKARTLKEADVVMVFTCAFKNKNNTCTPWEMHKKYCHFTVMLSL